MPHVPEALPRFDVQEELSFKLAATVRMDPFWQQELLELRDEEARLVPPGSGVPGRNRSVAG
jgi:hypothetical protein